MVPIGLARQVMLAAMATPALSPAPCPARTCRRDDLECFRREALERVRIVFEAQVEPQPEADRSA